MKIKSLVFLFIALTKLSSVFAQYEVVKDPVRNACLISKLDSMGIDIEPLLNKYEAEYFNAKFEESKGKFDFTDKKTAFFHSPEGTKISTKQAYFEIEKDRLVRNNSSNLSYLIILDEKERIESGGYDAVIVFWSKMYRTSEFYVKKLKDKKMEEGNNKKKKK